MAWRVKSGKWRRITLLFTIFLLFFGVEYITYFVLKWSWEQLVCPTTSHCTRFLFVADPQILGELDEPSWLTIWDNDRYLRRTFSSAVLFTKPDAAIFLGDLMDEGNRADNFEFKRYVNRFNNIFAVDTVVKTLFLPGDNDIGGENGDPILPSVVDRFRRTFHKKSELVVNSCRVLKVNPVLEPLLHPDRHQVSRDTFIRIAVSHFPLLGMSTSFSQKMLNDFKPHVVFSAHSHLSRIRGPAAPTPSGLTSKLGPILLGSNNLTRELYYEDDWTSMSDIHEIEVPTCSYRMGVTKMGYGYALIDETRHEFQYVVLWLPERLQHLKLYLAICIGLCFLTLCWCFCECKRSHHSYSVLSHHS